MENRIRYAFHTPTTTAEADRYNKDHIEASEMARIVEAVLNLGDGWINMQRHQKNISPDNITSAIVRNLKKDGLEEKDRIDRIELYFKDLFGFQLFPLDRFREFQCRLVEEFMGDPKVKAEYNNLFVNK